MTAQPAFADLEPSIVHDTTDADAGEGVLTWTRINMPLLRRLRAELHVEAK